MKSSFRLTPLDRNNAPAVAITGEIQRQNNQLAIAFKIAESSKIIIPKRASTPLRQFDLWEHTCCEFFLGLKDSTQYWEFNLSPAGHWNVFRFTDYRQDIAEETTFDRLPLKVLSQSDCLQINLTIDLEPIIEPTQDLEVGVTTVIEDKQNQLSYWALSHPGKEADFHLRSSFAIAL